MGGDATLTTYGERAAARERGGAAAIFVALDADRPTQPAARYSLAGIDTVLFGRGDQRTARRAGHTLTLSLPDRRMSTRHARLERAIGRWVLADAGSKNGTLMRGERTTTRAVLDDGAWFELGRTFLVYRDDVPSAHDTDAAAATSAAPIPALATLSPTLAARFDELARVARSTVSVLIGGESGTGKEVVARAVHALSGRRGRIVAVNCGGIPANLVEGQLFGHKKGAFSGAVDDQPGLVRTSDGGTLFLDEIGDLPALSQAAFLRVLQEREVLPVGGTQPVPIDLRLVAATHRDLEALVASGGFRADLLARIDGFRIALPPLRDRREDLGLIVAALLARLAPDRAERVTITVPAARALFAHDWPLNVRELEKCLAAALALAVGSAIDVVHLPAAVTAPRVPDEDPPPFVDELGDEERARRAQILALLAEHKGNIAAVARAMDRARPLVHRWIRRYGINVEEFRG